MEKITGHKKCGCLHHWTLLYIMKLIKGNLCSVGNFKRSTRKIFIYLLQDMYYFLWLTRMCTTTTFDSKTHSLARGCSNSIIKTLETSSKLAIERLNLYGQMSTKSHYDNLCVCCTSYLKLSLNKYIHPQLVTSAILVAKNW